MLIYIFLLASRAKLAKYLSKRKITRVKDVEKSESTLLDQCSFPKNYTGLDIINQTGEKSLKLLRCV
jgi:hypothetical protein